MTRAIYQDTVVAESSECVLLEGNHYFPPRAVDHRYLQPSATRTSCPWKGVASYYDVAVAGHLERDAAWYYPEPSPEAKAIKNHVAFWKGVDVQA